MDLPYYNQIILKVYLDASATQSTEVPITPQTTVGDVLDCCKEPGEEQCHLAELWRGCERPVNEEERPYEILQQWGIHRDEVRFFLRHESTIPGVQDDGRRVRRNRNGLREANQADNMLPHGVDLTLSELQEMAARQQQQIEAQQQLLVAKEQRLRFLKQQELRHEQIAAENERLRKLREKVEAQELKLKKLRALRGQVSEHKSNNNNLTAELEMIKSLFNEKEKELTMAVTKVEELTKQLEELRNGHVNSLTGDNKHSSPAFLELEKLRKELMVRNKLNEAQNSKLSAHREVMQQRKSEMFNMDHRIAELQQRLRKKRAQQQQQQQQQQRHDHNQQQQPPLGLVNQRGGSMNAKIGVNRPLSANIAAVEPYIKHVSNKEVEQQGYVISKHDPKYQTLPPNVKFPTTLEGKRGELEPNGNTMGYLGGEKRTDNGHMEKNNNGSVRDLKVETTHLSSSSGPSSPGKSALDLLPKEVVHRVPDYKPSKGHTTAFEVMEEVLKNSEKTEPKVASGRSIYGPVGYKAPSGLSNVTPRPFGSTYSTAMLANRPNLVAPQPGQASPVPTSSMSSPGAVFPKTSTPNNSGSSLNHSEMKEIFITGAPTVPSTGNKQPVYSTGSAGSQPNYPPLSVMTSSAGNTRPSDISPRSRPPDGKAGPPHYQIASSRPQQPMHPQRTRDPNSPPSGPLSSSSHSLDNKGPTVHPASTAAGRGPPKNPPSQANVNIHPATTPQGNFAATATSSNSNEGRPSAPGQFSVSTSTKVTLSERHASNSGPDSRSSGNTGLSQPSQSGISKGGSPPSITPSQGELENNQGQNQPLQRQGSISDDKEKRDITPSSVSSALSILMSGPSTTTTTMRPFRYAPKSVIANTYMRKLGSNTLDEYRKNMNQLYKDFLPSPPSDESTSSGQQVNGPEESGGLSGVPKTKVHVPDPEYAVDEPDLGPGQPAPTKTSPGDLHKPQSPRKLPESITSFSWGSSSEGEEEGPRSSSPTRVPPPYRGAPPYDIDAERMRYKPNAPKMLRRRLSSSESDDLNRNQTRSPTKNQTEEENLFKAPQPSQNQASSDSQNVIRVDTIQDSYNNNFSAEEANQEPSNKTVDVVSPHGNGEPMSAKQAQPRSQPIKENKPAAIRRKKTNLKSKDSVRSSRRVSFDPLALLLDASLEGELDLVMRTAQEVPDPSSANDEGITALHNAICAGHYDIVKFLSEFGCNVNAPDSDGWTPLHCAASCNNLAMVKLLVEHGACIFATTISDHETAAEKCEEDEDGYDGCSEYLYSVQEKLGIINKGVVYAVFDYSAQNLDELTFSDSNSLVVLRKGDELEKDWWWARHGDREGYIPRNLLGLHPRVPLKSQQDHDS